MGYIDLPVSGGGITIYPNLASFPPSAQDGAQGVAADTNSIYIYNASLPGWVAVATPPVGVFISDLTGDVTATGPGSAAATVAFVGGETAADVATSVQDTQAATDAATASTLVKRDSNADSSFNQANAAYFVSNDGIVSVTASYNIGLQILDVATNSSVSAGTNFVAIYDPSVPNGSTLSSSSLSFDTATTTVSLNSNPAGTQSYSLVLPPAQGAASTYLQNDGSGNLSWATVTPGMVNPMTAIGDLIVGGTAGAPQRLAIGAVDKVLASDGTTSTWQYAGLGGGALGSGNVVLGRSNPFTTQTNNVLIGDSATCTGSNTVVIGQNASSSINSMAIGYNSSAFNQSLVIGNSCSVPSGGFCTVIGNSANSTGSQAVFVGRSVTGNSTAGTTIGDAATNNGNVSISMGYASNVGLNADNCVVLGSVATAPAGGSNSITIGTGSSTGGLSNICAFGAASYQVNTFYLGRGAADQTVANSVKIMTMKASGTDTDLSVGTLTLAGSQSTGNKAGGDVIISTAPAGSSGSSLNSHVERIRAKAATEVVVNDTGVDFDFRVEGDTDANLLFVDAGNDRVGVGTATPATKLDVNGTAQATAVQVPNYILSPQLYDEGTETGNFTLNLSNGPAQQVTINAAGPLVITLSNPVTGGAYLIKIIQGATPGTVTWPANVLWGAAGAPVLSLATGDIDIINLFYDGTDYYGTYALGF